MSGKLLPGSISPELTRMVADKLTESVKKAFTGASIDFETPDYEMREQLSRNAFHFASAKNYQQVVTMSKALKDKDGNIRTWTQFREEAEKINRIYNESWLRTEYETALSSAQNAARWSEWKSREETVNLTYDAVNDERTRHSHKLLDGITKPITDPFWNTHYPPNGWRCRCGVMVSNRKPSTRATPNTPIPQMFKTNLAKYGILFPKSHPYFKNTPSIIRKQADLLYNKYEFETLGDDYITKLQGYPEVGFDEKTGGYIAVHKKHQKSTIKQHITTAKILKARGERILLIDDTKKADGVKSGDITRDGKLWEVKGITSSNYRNAIVKQISRAREQSDKVLIHITGRKNAQQIINGVEWSFDRYTHHKVMEVLINGKSIIINRGKVGDGRWREAIKKA